MEQENLGRKGGWGEKKRGNSGKEEIREKWGENRKRGDIGVIVKNRGENRDP